MNKGVVGALSLLVGAAGGALCAGKVLGESANEKQQMADKHLALFLMMNQWVKFKQEGKNLASYFEKEGYKEIAVYGMSYAGETLVDELAGTNVKIKYAIDRNADNLYADVDVVSPNEELEAVDAIVVTSITFFDEIEAKLSEKIDCPIISLEDILYEV